MSFPNGHNCETFKLDNSLQNGSILLKDSSAQPQPHLVSSERTTQCYTLEEVAFHDSYNDCWIILFDKVYNVTDFIQHHPGGETVLLEHAGRDATFTFLSAGHGDQMMAVLGQYLVGVLPTNQQLFHKTGINSSSN